MREVIKIIDREAKALVVVRSKPTTNLYYIAERAL